jgi:hypothetical protein
MCVLLAAAWLGGCNQDSLILEAPILHEQVADDTPLPTYTDLIQRYNMTTERLSPIWAEARVDLAWRNEKGKVKNEHGSGRFMFVSPGRVVLEVREVGKGFWAGADGERYWFFDLQDPSTTYVGRFDRLREPKARELPLPINPADLLYVMGLVPIDPALVPEEPAVERVSGYYLVEPPGLGLRMLLDPATARPIRVDVIDEQGNSTVICQLADPIPFKHGDPNDGLANRIASVVDVIMPGQEARMTLTLKKPTHSTRNIRDQHFDFEKLSRAFKTDEVVDLDAPVE